VFASLRYIGNNLTPTVTASISCASLVSDGDPLHYIIQFLLYAASIAVNAVISYDYS